MGIGKVYEGGRVGFREVVMRTTLSLGGGRFLTLGLTDDRPPRVIGEWGDRGMPGSWNPASLAKRLRGGLSRLLLAASSRPSFLLGGWHLALPPASVAARGGPLRRQRPAAHASSLKPPRLLS